MPLAVVPSRCSVQLKLRNALWEGTGLLLKHLPGLLEGSTVLVLHVDLSGISAF